MTTRVLLPDFSLANTLYEGSTVQAFTVDPATLVRTTTLAPLFLGLTGSTQASNPQTLDSEGKWIAPVYIDQPVAMVVSGPQFPTHETGVIANEIPALNALTPATIKVGATGWLEALIAATEALAQGASISTVGGPGFVFATRTSDGGLGSAGAQGAWAFGGFAINDNTTQVQTAYGGYVEVRRYPNAGVTEGIEIAAINQGDVKQGSPHNWAQDGCTMGLLLGAGRADVSPNHNPTTALVVTGATAKWQSGIIFGNTSIATHGAYPDARAVAIEFPRGYSLLWWDDHDLPAAYIRSDVTVSPDYHGAGGIIFTNDGIQFNSAAGSAAMVLDHTGLLINGTLRVQTSETVVTDLIVNGNTVLNTVTCNGVELLLGTLGVSGNAAFSGSLGAFGPLVVNAKMQFPNITLAGYADDAAAASAGLAIRDVYLNSTTKALTVRTA